MANAPDFRIQDLPEATDIGSEDNFLLEQADKAKRVPFLKFLAKVIDACAEKFQKKGVIADGLKSPESTWSSRKISDLLSKKADTTAIPKVPSWAMQPKKPSYTASEVGALPAGTKIPSKTSDLTNDSGYTTVGEAQKVYNGLYANALTRTVQGEAVAVDDVSALEHSVGCRLEPLNKLICPYADSSKTANGITFAVQEDGSIKADGLAAAMAQFDLAEDSWKHGLPLDPGDYFLSGCPEGGSESTYSLRLIANSPGNTPALDTGVGAAFKITNPASSNGVLIRIFPAAGEVHLHFKPMIHGGREKHPYTPPVSDMRKIKVLQYGQQLMDSRVRLSTEKNGISIESFLDGVFEIDIKKPVQNDTDFSILSWRPNGLPRGKYLFNAGVRGSGSVSVNVAFEKNGKRFGDAFYEDFEDHYVYADEGIGFIYLMIRVKKGAAAGRISVAPVLRLAGDQTRPNPLYVRNEKTVDEAGRVQGLTSLPGCMTLMDENRQTDLTLLYNQDPTVVIKKLTDRVSELENTQVKEAL